MLQVRTQVLRHSRALRLRQGQPQHLARIFLDERGKKLVACGCDLEQIAQDLGPHAGAGLLVTRLLGDQGLGQAFRLKRLRRAGGVCLLGEAWRGHGQAQKAQQEEAESRPDPAPGQLCATAR